MNNSSPAHEYAPTSVPVWTFGDKVRKARDTTGLDQKTFAARIDINASSLAAYETGRSTPRFKDAPAIAKRIQMLTGIPYEWFLVDDSAPVTRPTGGGSLLVMPERGPYRARTDDIHGGMTPVDEHIAIVTPIRSKVA